MAIWSRAQVESHAVCGSVDGDTIQAPRDVSVNLVRVCIIAIDELNIVTSSVNDLVALASCPMQIDDEALRKVRTLTMYEWHAASVVSYHIASPGSQVYRQHREGLRKKLWPE